MLGDDDEGPLCHFEVDEHGDIRQRVDPALAYVPNVDVYPEFYFGFDGAAELYEEILTRSHRMPLHVQYETTNPEPPSGISAHWTNPNTEFTPVPLWEWIESLPEPEPFVLTVAA